MCGEETKLINFQRLKYKWRVISETKWRPRYRPRHDCGDPIEEPNWFQNHMKRDSHRLTLMERCRVVLHRELPPPPIPPRPPPTDFSKPKRRRNLNQNPILYRTFFFLMILFAVVALILACARRGLHTLIFLLQPSC